jgi:hypothetical protein
MEIENLKIPIEVLENILSFVPKKDRKNNCRLVNKTFNSVISFLDDPQSMLVSKMEDFVSLFLKFQIIYPMTKF